MNYQKTCGLLLVAILSSHSLQATSAMRPGLWEYTSTVKSQNGQMEQAMGQMEEQMASLPPEQRKKMEKMMASHGVAKSPKGNTIQVCVTKEDAKQGLAVPTKNGQCQQQIVRRSGSTVWFKYACKGNPPSSGEGEYTINDNSAYKGKMTMHTTVEGRAEVVQMNHSGKWISNNCGNIKPYSPPKY